jgi:tetratricopeptide (TPR) repeat protein
MCRNKKRLFRDGARTVVKRQRGLTADTFNRRRHVDLEIEVEQSLMSTRFFFSCVFVAVFSLAPIADDAKSTANGDEKAAKDSGKSAPPVTGSQTDAAKAQELFEAGRKLFFQADYKGAVTKLASAVAADPSKTTYKLLLAKAHRQAGAADKATAVLEEILKTNADHVEAGIELAELLSPQKQPDRVIAVLEPLLKYKHDYPLYHLLGEAHYQKEQLDKARGYFEEAIKLNAQSADDHYQLGNIYLAQKRFAKAAQVYERAGQLGMSSGAYHFKLASVYYNLHRYLGNVTTAEVRGGQGGQIKNNLFLIDRVPGGKDVFYVAHPQSAIFQVAKAQELGIDIFEIRFLEANIWLSAKRFRNADRIYQELEKKVKSTDVGLFWFYWAQTALGLDEYEKYLARMEKAIVADSTVYKPMLADAFVTVATRYHQQGNTAKYIEYLAKAVAENPLSARLHMTLGDAFWLDNNRGKAIEQYKLVLELEPDHGDRVRLLNRIRGQEV